MRASQSVRVATCSHATGQVMAGQRTGVATIEEHRRKEVPPLHPGQVSARHPGVARQIDSLRFSQAGGIPAPPRPPPPPPPPPRPPADMPATPDPATPPLPSARPPLPGAPPLPNVPPLAVAPPDPADRPPEPETPPVVVEPPLPDPRPPAASALPSVFPKGEVDAPPHPPTAKTAIPANASRRESVMNHRSATGVPRSLAFTASAATPRGSGESSDCAIMRG